MTLVAEIEKCLKDRLSTGKTERKNDSIIFKRQFSRFCSIYRMTLQFENTEIVRKLQHQTDYLTIKKLDLKCFLSVDKEYHGRNLTRNTLFNVVMDNVWIEKNNQDSSKTAIKRWLRYNFSLPTFSEIKNPLSSKAIK